MSKPKVSICMPTLNSEAFLAPRLESIRRQTLTDWELVVVDSQSDDQTLSMIDAFSKQGGTVRVVQGPRDGIYTNINRSIEQARGEYVYIATSDDTMADDCLEKMSLALDQQQACGLAHCGLRMLDAEGDRVEDDWWPVRSIFASSAGDQIDRTHIRVAPYDGLLHTLGRTVYTSLTQLLIRRTLFDRVGMFRSDWGSISDYYWDMRAALTTDTVHVGDTWASWRIHESQATASAEIGKNKHTDKIEAMIDQALGDAKQDMPAEVYGKLDQWRGEAKEMRAFLQTIQATGGRPGRWAYLTKQLLKGSAPAKHYLRGKFVKDASLPGYAPKIIEGWLRSVGLEATAEASVAA